MDTITPGQLREICDMIDLEYSAVSPNYSGRGMYGATCVGFVHNGNSFALGAAMYRVLGCDALEMHPSTDSMGLDQITYFHGLTIDGEWEYED